VPISLAATCQSPVRVTHFKVVQNLARLSGVEPEKSCGHFKFAPLRERVGGAGQLRATSQEPHSVSGWGSRTRT
jgi:hypothetical protein